ncbi:hypothetical protein X777_09085 [Ooceraea biroi]|uniref:Uncharacterized protein n=1 Tax=Ooceraea biroi TaxID=2015173 RepID=A0A026W7K2_OOCBI|nr:hypothetical protein X777_09085 [Ooceraea biroi]
MLRLREISADRGRRAEGIKKTNLGVRRKNIERQLEEEEEVRSFIERDAQFRFPESSSFGSSEAPKLRASERRVYVPRIVTKVSQGVLRGSRQVDRSFFPGIPITRVEQVIVCPYPTPAREG